MAGTNGTNGFKRPVSLLAQLKCFWQLTDELREDIDNLSPGGGGTQGPPGNDGPPGPPGPPGSPGATGPKGDQGDQGDQGPPGADGPAGPQGADGPQGPAGPQGEIGPTGNTGPQGPQGAPGADSTVPGPQGPAGADSTVPGPQGNPGPQGLKGDTGDIGPQGEVGPEGPQGDQGIQGQTGQQGIQGNPGIQGPPGADGVRTASTAFGYSAGAGGTVTQATNKTTAVTLNKLTGQITMASGALAAGAIATFVFNNNQVEAADMLAVSHHSGGTFGPYLINGRVTGNGVCSIAVRNTSAASLNEAPVIKFAVVKAVTV